MATRKGEEKRKRFRQGGILYVDDEGDPEWDGTPVKHPETRTIWYWYKGAPEKVVVPWCSIPGGALEEVKRLGMVPRSLRLNTGIDPKDPKSYPDFRIFGWTH